MIVWRGWGILVAILIFGTSLAANELAIFFGGKGYWETHAWPFGCAMIVAGVFIWIADALLSKKPTRTLVDEKTGQKFVLDKTPTFFLSGCGGGHWCRPSLAFS